MSVISKPSLGVALFGTNFLANCHARVWEKPSKFFGGVRPADDAGLTPHLENPVQPDFTAFCPAPGHNYGFNKQKVVEAHDLLLVNNGGANADPNFAEGLNVAKIIHAMAASNGALKTIGQNA